MLAGIRAGVHASRRRTLSARCTSRLLAHKFSTEADGLNHTLAPFPSLALGHVLSPLNQFRPRVSDIDEWTANRERECKFSPFTIEAAIYGGFHSDRAAFAFASGYQAALHSCNTFDLAPNDIGALCASEKSGVSPKDMKTSLTKSGSSYILSGEKTFVSLGTKATDLWVVARDMSSTIEVKGVEQHPLRIVRVEPGLEGVTLTKVNKTLPFVPEIPHAVAQFDNVTLPRAEVALIDGNTEVLKPFRTIEDVHVAAAITAYVLRLSRELSLDRRILSSLVGVLVQYLGFASLNPQSPVAHIAMAGSQLRPTLTLVEEAGREALSHLSPSSSLAEEFLRFFEHDIAILDVASRARNARTGMAWNVLDNQFDSDSGSDSD